MATAIAAKLKRKPRLSKFESYKAASTNTKEVYFRLKFCVLAHRDRKHNYRPTEARPLSSTDGLNSAILQFAISTSKASRPRRT